MVQTNYEGILEILGEDINMIKTIIDLDDNKRIKLSMHLIDSTCINFDRLVNSLVEEKICNTNDIKDYVNNSFDIEDVYNEYEIVNAAKDLPIGTIFDNIEIGRYIKCDIGLAGIYSTQELTEEIKRSFEIDEVFSLESIKEWAKYNFRPDDIFSDMYLTECMENSIIKDNPDMLGSLLTTGYLTLDEKIELIEKYIGGIKVTKVKEMAGLSWWGKIKSLIF